MSEGTAQGQQMRESIIQAMQDYYREYDRAPTVRELAALVRPDHPLSSGLISYHLKVLQRGGRVTHDAGLNRTYRVLGAVPTGTPESTARSPMVRIGPAYLRPG